MKICTLCNQEKEEKDFYNNSKKIHAYCKKCFNQYCSARWKERRKLAIEKMGNCCIDCNKQFHPNIYEIHHLDPKQKDFNWSKMKGKSQEIIDKELAKCVLLCANCHRLRHAKEQNQYNNAYTRNARRVKKELVNSFGNKCLDCNQGFDHKAYDFHHLDPAQKDFNISHKSSVSAALEELSKCVMLCANCHRARHIQINDFIKPQKQIKTITYNECPICNKQKLSNYETCSKQCYRKLNNEIDWNNLDLASLLREYKTYTGVARHLNCSDTAVINNLKKLGLLHKKEKSITEYDFCPICGKEKLISLVTCSEECAHKKSRKVDWDNINLLQILQDNNYNLTRIGKMLGCSDNAVKKRMKIINIPMRILPEKEYDNCPICNNTKLTTNKTCSVECSSVQQMRFDWTNIDLEKLLQENDNNLNKVAKIIGCAHATIRKRIKLIRQR